MKYFLPAIIILMGLLFFSSNLCIMRQDKNDAYKDLPEEMALYSQASFSDTRPCYLNDINFDDPNICVWCGDCIYWMYKKPPYTEILWDVYFNDNYILKDEAERQNNQNN